MIKNNLVTSVIILIVFVAAVCILINKGPNVPREEVNPDTSSQGKLDINVVCEGALAYMTFPDAASAELFVQECKEGKHPQVIEEYKARMDLGDGADI